jgi:hypothetical protein
MEVFDSPTRYYPSDALSLDELAYRKPSAKAPVIHPGMKRRSLLGEARGAHSAA